MGVGSGIFKPFGEGLLQKGIELQFSCVLVWFVLEEESVVESGGREDGFLETAAHSLGIGEKVAHRKVQEDKLEEFGRGEDLVGGGAHLEMDTSYGWRLLLFRVLTAEGAECYRRGHYSDIIISFEIHFGGLIIKRVREIC
jgi:hypothetical protein